MMNAARSLISCCPKQRASVLRYVNFDVASTVRLLLTNAIVVAGVLCMSSNMCYIHCRIVHERTMTHGYIKKIRLSTKR